MKLKNKNLKKALFIDITNNDPQFLFLILKSIENNIAEDQIDVHLTNRAGWDYSFIRYQKILEVKDVNKAKKSLFGKLNMMFRILRFWINTLRKGSSQVKIYYVWSKYSFPVDVLFLFVYRIIYNTDISLISHRPDLLLNNRLIIPLLNSAFNNGVVFSKYASKLMVERGFKGEIKVILHPNFNELMKERGIAGDVVPRIKLRESKFSLLFISSLSTEHGINRLMEIIDQFISKGLIDYHFYVCGNYRSTQEQRNARLLLERYSSSDIVTLLLGFYSQEEATFLIENSDVVICPYEYNVQSGVIAMAKGFNKRVISADVGAAKEMLSSHDLLIAHDADIDEWVSSIIRFVVDKPDLMQEQRVPDSSILQEIFA